VEVVWQEKCQGGWAGVAHAYGSVEDKTAAKKTHCTSWFSRFPGEMSAGQQLALPIA
jgi:hypothetical protein